MPQQTTKKSTLFRMIYLHQPIAGLLTKTSQLFSGRVISLISFSSGCTDKAKQQNITSTTLTLLSSDSGSRITEYQHKQKALTVSGN